ncbi:MAG: hypothetical protein AABZ10_00415 [Nitrospirota bacterium]
MNYRASLVALSLLLSSFLSPAHTRTALSFEPPTPPLFQATKDLKGKTALILAAKSDKKESVEAYDGMKWEGHASQQTKRLVKVITDNDEWTALWRRAFDTKAPAVDFNNYAVACVFLGHEADWLYSIAFGEPSLKDGRMVIPYWLGEIYLELAGPFKASGQYHMKVFKKKTGVEMILKEERPL